jgi:hypothetical protein
MKNPTSSMLSVHSAAIDAKAASFHEFLLRYSKKRTIVYGFVEGKTDPTYYRGFIEYILPEGWDVELWPAGNKTSVLAIHANIDWSRYPKNRVCFFIDRDLSDLVKETLVKDVNIYITDCYSIENDVVKSSTVRRALTEIFGFSSANHSELDRACEAFNQALEAFMLAMVPLMAWILYWRRKSIPANLNDISMQHLFEYKSGVFLLISNPRGKSDYW